MSNKLIKQKDLDRKQQKHQKTRKLCAVSLAGLIVLFLFIWANVAITSFRFQKQLEQMVLGKDYFVEEVVITKKDWETSSSSQFGLTTNYFFYYGADNSRRMEVSQQLYNEYEAGDSIPAYTTDHVYYDYEKDGILPRDQFRNNELMKAAGALCGCAVGMLALYLWLSKDWYAG